MTCFYKSFDQHIKIVLEVGSFSLNVYHIFYSLRKCKKFDMHLKSINDSIHLVLSETSR